MGLFTENKEDWLTWDETTRERDFGLTKPALRKRERDERKIGSFKWGAVRGERGHYSLNEAFRKWRERNKNRKYYTPFFGPRRTRHSARGMGLTQAGERKPSKSSKDTMKESYSTIETRLGKPLSTDPRSGFETFGAEKADTVSRLYKEDTDKGAVRRTTRSIL